MSPLVFASVIYLLSLPVFAQHDDMGDGMGSDMGGGTMKAYLHFTPGDSVLFGPWIPNTSWSIFRTCVGVFLLAIVDRWFSAMTAVMNSYWNER
jgi:solute carrier family 31 (copper transporter), member 1